MNEESDPVAAALFARAALLAARDRSDDAVAEQDAALSNASVAYGLALAHRQSSLSAVWNVAEFYKFIRTGVL